MDSQSPNRKKLATSQQQNPNHPKGSPFQHASSPNEPAAILTLEDQFKNPNHHPKSRFRDRSKAHASTEGQAEITGKDDKSQDSGQDSKTKKGAGDKAVASPKRGGKAEREKSIKKHSRVNSRVSVDHTISRQVAHRPEEERQVQTKVPVKRQSISKLPAMPTPQSTNRRVKGKRIERSFLIGSEAWKLDPNNPPPKKKELHTTGWRVYIRPVVNGPDLGAWLKRVVFVLHPTFENPVRSVEGPPFELEETGYGGFSISIKLYFQPYAAEKQQVRTHFLQLEPYGNEELLAIQKRDNLVRSEYVEVIEFNEPTEQLFDALTNDNQWDYLLKGRGKGKNRGGLSMSLPAPHERTVELPDNAPEGSVYSKDAEEKLLKVIAEAEQKVQIETEEILKKTKELEEKKLKQIESNEVNARLLGLSDKLPASAPAPKKR